MNRLSIKSSGLPANRPVDGGEMEKIGKNHSETALTCVGCFVA
jgi:hypothetical protein